MLEMVVDMGFPERMAKKAMKRVDIPEPTMIIDMLINGKVSDDEEEEEPKEEGTDEENDKKLEALDKCKRY